MVAGSFGSRHDYLYERLRPFAIGVAKRMRIVDRASSTTLDIGERDNLGKRLMLPEEAFLVRIQRAKDIVLRGQFEAETLFGSVKASREAAQFANELVDAGYSPDRWEALCKQLGLQIEVESTGANGIARIRLAEDEEVAYGHVAVAIIEAYTTGESSTPIIAATIAKIERDSKQ